MIITNIQRFSLHDGPGIRTTVFFKGCSIRCPWCANPENFLLEPQRYIKDGKEGIYGKDYSCDDIYAEVIKDKAFYTGELRDYDIADSDDLKKLPGGVTFSGGECLMQMRDMEPLLQRFGREHIHMAVETSLFVAPEFFTISLNYIDLYYVDLKILDECKCCSILKGDLQLFLLNLQLLMKSGKPVVFRIPVIGGVTDIDENRCKIVELIKNIKGNILKIELLKEHNLGISKYQSLINAGNDIVLPKYKGVSDEVLERYKEEIMKVVNIPVEVCKI